MPKSIYTEEIYRKIDVAQPDYPAYRDISLAPFTSFASGGNAQLLLLPRGRAELQLALQLLAEFHSDGKSEPVAALSVLGGGANMLVADRGVRGVVLSLRRLQGIEWQAERGRLCAESGWDMSALCRYCAGRNAAGLHHFYGMPGSLGGAVYMNARCYGGEMSQVVRRVQCIPRAIPPRGVSRAHAGSPAVSPVAYAPEQLRWVELSPKDWRYKYSHFQLDSGHELAGALIVAVELELREQGAQSLEREMQSFLEDRIVKGHFRLPCGGSFFKNNRAFGAPTGQIIDSLGLKGLRVGGAQLAPWHGNIIVNSGSASSGEIWALACRIRSEVRRRCGFELEPEVQRLGYWDDVDA